MDEEIRPSLSFVHLGPLVRSEGMKRFFPRVPSARLVVVSFAALLGLLCAACGHDEPSAGHDEPSAEDACNRFNDLCKSDPDYAALDCSQANAEAASDFYETEVCPGGDELCRTETERKTDADRKEKEKENVCEVNAKTCKAAWGCMGITW
jgi:hypothetical protein